MGLPPKPKWYDCPITVLNFASFYPSIMVAQNLCYSTLFYNLTIDQLKLREGEDYVVTPNNNYFAKPNLRKLVLPNILKGLLLARKHATADLEIEEDPSKGAVLNGFQWALEVAANAIYGFTGTPQLPCLENFQLGPAHGRQIIEATKMVIESHYTIANGYEHDAQVIYSGTDSLLIAFAARDLEAAMQLGTDFVEATWLPHPIKLEFD